MTWLRRAHEALAPPSRPDAGDPAPHSDDDDSPDALRRRLWDLVAFVNVSSGRLPVAAFVLARQIADTVREVIDMSADRQLDIYAVVSINGIVGDYLPTTLRGYLALDDALVDEVSGGTGTTPRASLLAQLDALDDAADELARAAREHDVDALFTQGNFLRTKFNRSDLEL